MQVYEALKAEIYRNVEVGSFLPAEEALMEKYGVSRTTLRHAVQLLKKDGIVEVKQGLGTRVMIKNEINNDDFLLFHNVTNASHYFPNTPENWTSSVHGGFIEIIPATPSVAKAFNVSVGEQVYRIERMISLNNESLILCRNYYLVKSFPDLIEYRGKIEYLHNLHGFFEWKYDTSISFSEQYISISKASFFDAKVLNLEPDTAVFSINRTFYSGDVPFEYGEWLANPNLLNIKISTMGPRNFFRVPTQKD